MLNTCTRACPCLHNTNVKKCIKLNLIMKSNHITASFFYISVVAVKKKNLTREFY